MPWGAVPHHHAHIGALGCQLALGFAQHRLSKTVILADQVHVLQCLVLAHHVHERGHAHVGMGIKAEMPEAALLVGQTGFHGGIVQNSTRLAGSRSLCLLMASIKAAALARNYPAG